MANHIGRMTVASVSTLAGQKYTGKQVVAAAEALGLELDDASILSALPKVVKHLKDNPPRATKTPGVSQKDPKDVALAESLFIKNFWSLVEDADLDTKDDWGLHMPKLTGFGGLTFRYITPSAPRNTIYIEEDSDGRQNIMIKDDKKLKPATWDKRGGKWVVASARRGMTLDDLEDWEADLRVSAPAEYAKRMKMRDIQKKVPAKPKKRR